jgi:alkylhydroperoxidase family enzyme
LTKDRPRRGESPPSPRGDEAFRQNGRVAHIRLIEPEDASGLLAEEYAAAVKRAGKVYNILKSMSLRPGVLQASMAMYRAIMFGDSALTRQERELLATVVSATNECYY